MSGVDFTSLDYVIIGEGGFSTEQYLGEIPYIGTNFTDMTQLFDLTNVLHINFDVRIFNDKIGIYKNESNTTVINSSSTTIKDIEFGVHEDFITITADEFLNNIKPEHIVSLGKYETLYRDFKRKADVYFGYATKYETLFDKTGNILITSDIITPNNLVELLTERSLDNSNNYVYNLSGFIQVYQLTNILSFLSETNPFNNRTFHTRNDGFIAGDRILILSGITITLELRTGNKEYITTPLYNNDLILKHTINAPLLLTLQNLS